MTKTASKVFSVGWAEHEDRPSNPALGALYAILATLLAALMFTIVKLLSSYPPVEIVFFRSFASLVILFPLLGVAGVKKAAATKHFFTHFCRSFFGFSALILAIIAFARLPLADVSAIGFSRPFFVLPLALLFLGERFRVPRLLAMLVGFSGVLIIIQPGTAEYNPDYLYAVGATFLAAVAMLYVRQLTLLDDIKTNVFHFVFFSFVVSGLLLPFYYQQPTTNHLLLFLLAGALTVALQFSIVAAHKYAEASFVSPFVFCEIIWTGVLGFVIWNDVPTVALVVGACLIFLAKLFMVIRERQVGLKLEVREAQTSASLSP